MVAAARRRTGIVVYTDWDFFSSVRDRNRPLLFLYEKLEWQRGICLNGQGLHHSFCTIYIYMDPAAHTHSGTNFFFFFFF